MDLEFVDHRIDIADRDIPNILMGFGKKLFRSTT
jgi:hypothetical protein